MGLDLDGFAVASGAAYRVPVHFTASRLAAGGAVKNQRGSGMSVAKVVEINAASSKGFEDAMKIGIERASKTLSGVKGAWVQEQNVIVEDGKIKEYRVNMKVTFLLEG